jgi:predicted transcriptional regulator
MEFLKGKGYFTFQELKLPPSLSREKARVLIRDLVSEGYFIPAGKGRTIRYQMTDKVRQFMEKKDPAETLSSASSEEGKDKI